MMKNAMNSGTQKMLSGILANTYVLFTKVWEYHVNYIGPDFVFMHPKLGDWRDELYDDVDSLAEQIRKTCWISPFSLEEFKAAAVIKESPGKLVSMTEALNDIYNSYCTLDTGIDKAISLLGDDLITQNLLIDIRGDHDKIKWFIRSTLGQC